MDDGLIPRRALASALETASTFRAVVLQGARQAGKSTLAELVAAELGATVVSLDREVDRRAAIDDPESFLDSYPGPLVIDEVQRAGDRLVLALKQRLDRSRRRGQYVLTGSTNFLTGPTITESLAGRIGIVTLWPLALCEIEATTGSFVARAFIGPEELIAHRAPSLARQQYLEAVCRGGYPEIQSLPARSRRRWFEQYLETVLRREVATVADLRRFDGLQAMARLLLSSTGAELIASRLADALRLDRATVETYEPWVETTFLVHRVPAWSRKPANRVVRRPKLHAVDTGLAAAVVGTSPAALARHDEPATGPLVETFVVNEIAKQTSWADDAVRLHHLRETDGLEVDLILESNDGRIVAVEVKASTVGRPEDARAMAVLRDRLDRLGDAFVAGIVFHTGDRRTRLGDRLVGLPISDIWT